MSSSVGLERTRRGPRTWAWAVLALSLHTSPVWAQGEGTQTSTQAAVDAEAVKHFKAARAFYKAGKYVEALLDFQKAYELKPTGAITYNIARCYEQLSQWTEAIKAYERYLKETSDARERAETLDKIEFLRSKLSADDSSPEARYKARIEAGKKAFSRSLYEEAIAEFKAAYDLKASSGVLFNIAKAYERLGNYEEAIDYFQQYLDLDPNAMDRPDVEEAIRRLKKSIRERFQELSVSSEPPGADIYLDDRNTGLQGQTNYRFKVTPGPHTLYVDLNGFEPVKRDFVMPDDKPLALEFAMKKLENVGYAAIKVNVDGARIFIDGAIIGLSPYPQKKALTAGEHQITIEAQGFPRHTQKFTVERDKDAELDILLAEYDAPVEDDTLEKWGNNLLLIGLIGGTLGIVGPFAYQKLILRRDLNEQVGPTTITWGEGVAANDATFWMGAGGPGSRDNGEADTLSAIQIGSIIGGGILTGAGLGFYIYKWARPTDKTAVIQADVDSGDSGSWVEITNFGMSPTDDGGANIGLSGRF